MPIRRSRVKVAYLMGIKLAIFGPILAKIWPKWAQNGSKSKIRLYFLSQEFSPLTAAKRIMENM